jgi:hypothetical protein
MVVMSPNINFNESSISCTTANPGQDLNGLRNAFDTEGNIHEKETNPGMSMEAGRDMNKWESDEEILRLRATEDEDIPNGPNPVVPLIPREPDTHAHQHCHSEIEHLADAAGLQPTHEKRRPRATVSTAERSGIGGNHYASVGVTEIKEKIAGNARKCTYYEVLLATEVTHLHNEPTDIREAKERPDWPKWKAVMQEELDSLK